MKVEAEGMAFHKEEMQATLSLLERTNMTVDFGTRLNQQAQDSSLQIHNTLKVF